VEKEKALEMAVLQIERQYGKGSIMRLGDDVTVKVPAISTGSLGLDLALGVGGIPRAAGWSRCSVRSRVVRPRWRST
jgi:recombination protein RecA